MFPSSWPQLECRVRLLTQAPSPLNPHNLPLDRHIACISDDVDGALNPMWQPHWEAKDPSKIPYDGTASLSRG